MNIFKIKDQFNREIIIDSFDDITNYQPLNSYLPNFNNNDDNDSNSNNELIKKKYFLTPRSTPLISDGAPPRSSLTRPWLTRITTSYAPTSSFCYEITFPHQNPLGLSLKPKTVYYSSMGSNKYMGMLVVEESQSLLSTVVYPGDIILKINDILLVNFGDDFDFEIATNIITSTSSPRVIRFLRPLGPDHTLSPAEIATFLSISSLNICQCNLPTISQNENSEVKEENNSSNNNMNNVLSIDNKDSSQTNQQGNTNETTQDEEKINNDKNTTQTSSDIQSIPQLSEPIAKFNVVLNAANASQSLHLMSLDSQAPISVKKIMQGGKVNWETPQTTANPLLAQSQSQSQSSKGIGIKDNAFEEINTKLCREVYRESNGPASVNTVTSTGSYNTGGKWIAQLLIAAPPPNNRNKRSLINTFCVNENQPKKILRRYFLGRFETEDDANAVVKIARNEWNATGNFTPRRIIPPPKPGTYLSNINNNINNINNNNNSNNNNTSIHGHLSNTSQSYNYNSQYANRLSAAQHYIHANNNANNVNGVNIGSGNIPGQQIKPMYYNSGDMGKNTTIPQVPGLRTQSIPTTLPSHQSGQYGQYNYNALLSRGGNNQSIPQNSSSIGPYFNSNAPTSTPSSASPSLVSNSNGIIHPPHRSQMSNYPIHHRASIMDNNLVTNPNQIQTGPGSSIPPFANQQFQRPNTIDSNGYSTQGTNQDGQIMYLGSNIHGPRGQNVNVFPSSNVLPQQSLPSFPRTQSS